MQDNMKDQIKILVLGDIVGRIARDALRFHLGEIKKEEESDFVIANGENLMHGSGLNEKTIAEAFGAGIDFLTSGNHLGKDTELGMYAKEDLPIIRPANFPPNVPGYGFRIVKIKDVKVAIINLLGRVFFKMDYDCPFRKFDEIYEQVKEEAKVILVDFHAEATSEKVAFSWYADGRASAVWGTHTHVPTADARILPNGTFCQTDLGMVGAYDSVLGVEKQGIIDTFLTQIPHAHDIPEKGEVELNGVLLKISADAGKVVDFKAVRRVLKT